MSTTVLTVIDRLASGTNPVPHSGPKSDLEGLTSLVSLALTARARLRLDQGDRAFALVDLEESLRHEPGNYEAIELRDQIQGESAGAEPGPTRPVVHEATEGDGSWAIYSAGYQVMARYPDQPDYDGDPIGGVHQHTILGRSQAIQHAKYLCSEESSRARVMLYDGDLTSGEVFDAVVVEVQSLVREIHLEKGLEEDNGESLVSQGSDF